MNVSISVKLKMLKLGISPCPNDIFIFYGLLRKKIDLKGLDFEFLIDDVETLNNLCLKKKLPISKISAHSYYYLEEDYKILNSGGAVSEEGPVAVMKDLDLIDKALEIRIALPGKFTTATALMWFFWKKFFKHKKFKIFYTRYDKIYEKLLNDEVDVGVLIHEGRFTYEKLGFKLLCDLGDFWKTGTDLPIPLGAIVMMKNLNFEEKLENLIRESIVYSRENQEEVINFAKNYAQELSREVIISHIKTYVNEYSINLGKVGIESIEMLKKKISKEGLWELNHS